MTSWITKNGRHIQISSRRRTRVSRSDIEYSTTTLHRQVSKIPSYRIVSSKPIKKQEKKWYEEGWRKQIHKFNGTDFAIDLGNFGNSNFSFSIRKGNKEIFTVPKSLIKNAISCGFTATTGIPGCPFDVPIDAIEYAIKLYDQLTG